MKQIQGIWFPDTDTHFEQIAKKINLNEYQRPIIKEALKYVKKKDLAVDVGAHVGLITRQLEQLFYEVYSFEPDYDSFECLKKNHISYYSKLYENALGEKKDWAWTKYQDPNNSGSNYIDKLIGCNYDPDCSIVTLDSFDLYPNYIKIDTQGYEYFVLRGAEVTIAKYQPVISMEIHKEYKKWHGRYGLKPSSAEDLLKDWGYKRVARIKGDIVMVYDA